MDIASLFIVGLLCAGVGWGMISISARIERQRALHNLEKYGPPGGN
jgi:hypothetical protein